MNVWSAWSWIDRDLNSTRPFSLLLILLPFIPFAISLEASADPSVHDVFLLVGLTIAAPWFLYVIWRGLLNIIRAFKDAGEFFAKGAGDKSDG